MRAMAGGRTETTSPAWTDVAIGTALQPLCYDSVAQMGDSKALPGFGQVDLDIEDDAAAPSQSQSRRVEDTAPAGAFGSLELEVGEPDEPQPPSTSRVLNAENGPAPVRDRAISLHDESTRIVRGDALSEMTRPQVAAPAPQASAQDDGSTRAWADIDEALAAEDDSSASRSGNQAAPSASGVASRGDDRVAAMRELYARGDAAGALALASTLGHGVALPSTNSLDSPDASIVVEFGEQSIDLADPFGGLIPMDGEEGSADEEAVPVSRASAVGTVPPPAAEVSLSQRQSIPRRLTALADLSKLKIDHRAGFLLAHVDGMQTLEEILDVCAMPAAEALALFSNLEALGVIEFE